MKVITDATIAKNLLIDFQTYVKAFTKQGPTDLTVYTENFAAKLMEIYYGYPFVNMNYTSKNTAGIDLLNKEKDHGIQFTVLDNSADKVINSFKKSREYNKITVFFFTINKTDTIVKHVKEKKQWKENAEVISLVDVFSLIELDPSIAKQCKDLCELWLNGNTNYYNDIITKLNLEMNKRVEANIRSRKYIPEIYIPEIRLKNNCRNFADPTWSTQLLINKIPTYYAGYCYDMYKSIYAKLENETILSLAQDCDASRFLSRDYPELHINSIIEKLKNYMRMTESAMGKISFFDQNDRELSIDERYSFFENGVHFKIQEDLQQYDFSTKKYLFIVKDAGQGKTNFLCDFCSNVLARRKIPTILINVNELTKNLLDTVKDYISLIMGRDINNSIQIIEQYCSVTNKKLLICIDGLNEKSNLSQFKNEVLELFRFVDTYDFIKIIATSRNKAYETFYSTFKNEAFSELIAEDIESDRTKHRRKPKNFENRIYAKYREFFNITCYISSEAIKKLSNDTLLLRIFSEVYANNTAAIVNDIYLHDLFEAYINKRSSQLLNDGRVKRKEDLTYLFYKISRKMIDTHELNGFSYDGFSSEEKDLIDLIVQEDIVLKSSEENGISLFGNKESFSFTYDEFRDYLLACVILEMSSEEIKNEIKSLYDDAERFEGVLRYLFLFYKTKRDDRLSILEDYPGFIKVYSENIFSVEDRFLSERDIIILKNALKNKNIWVYSQVANRLDITQYKNISVKSIVEVYIELFAGDPNWDKIFFDSSIYYHEESGILPSLLQDKCGSTDENEVYGILLLLCTIRYYKCKEKYLIWLREKYPKQYIDALSKIRQEENKLIFEADFMMGIGVE